MNGLEVRLLRISFLQFYNLITRSKEYLTSHPKIDFIFYIFWRENRRNFKVILKRLKKKVSVVIYYINFGRNSLENCAKDLNVDPILHYFLRKVTFCFLKMRFHRKNVINFLRQKIAFESVFVNEK